MDIHKPKPWRGLREFLKEIGTIVVGVLIALGAEQTVEWLHRQHEVGEAREVLREEMAGDARLAKLRLEETPCMQALLDRAAAWADGGPPPIWRSYDLGVLNVSAWDEAKTAAVPHMPLKERIAYDKFYAGAIDSNQVIRDVRASFGELSRYQAMSKVPAEARLRALEDVARAKAQVLVLAGYDRGMLAVAASMGVNPPPYTRRGAEGLSAICAAAASARR
jgi:hypothetical protein